MKISLKTGWLSNCSFFETTGYWRHVPSCSNGKEVVTRKSDFTLYFPHKIFMFRPFLIAYAQPFWPPESQHKTVNKINRLSHTKNYWAESVCIQTHVWWSPKTSSQLTKSETDGGGWSRVAWSGAGHKEKISYHPGRKMKKNSKRVLRRKEYHAPHWGRGITLGGNCRIC